MPNLETFGRWITLTGIVIAVLGGALWLAGRLNFLNKLPGVLRFEGKGMSWATGGCSAGQ